MRISAVQKGLLATLVLLIGGYIIVQKQRTAEPMETSVSSQECDPTSFEHLVGQSSDSLDLTALPENTRVIFPDTMVTRDYRVERMNIDVDEAGIIQRIWCG